MEKGVKKKSEKQKLGEALVLQMNELFPSHDLNDIINAVKKSQLNLELAISILLEEEEKKKKTFGIPPEIDAPNIIKDIPDIKENKVEISSNNNGEISEDKTPKEEITKEDEGIVQVLAVLPSASKELILNTIKKCNGDTDLAILTLLNLKNEDEEDFVMIEKEDEDNLCPTDDFDDEQWAMLDISDTPKFSVKLKPSKQDKELDPTWKVMKRENMKLEIVIFLKPKMKRNMTVGL